MDAHYYLLKDQKVLIELPKFDTAGNWSVEEVSAVSFKDVNGDGLRDIIIIAQYVTGIGPTGMRPFYVKDVFFQAKNHFYKIEKITKEINSDKLYDKLKSIKAIVKHLKQSRH